MNGTDVLDDMLPDQAPPVRKRRRPAEFAAVPNESTFPPLDGEGSAQNWTTPPARAASIPDEVLLVCGSDLKPEPVMWLWDGWLARGKVHILAGAPGQGKTTLAIAIAATVTIGGRFPDNTSCPQGNVLIWSGEDEPADTLLPRLIAAGGDRSRVYFITGARVDGQLVPFDPARDMAQLMAAVGEIGNVGLLVVDPVVSAVQGDSHKNTEVRRAMQPLVDLGALTGAAVLGISHFSKGGQGQDPTQRVVGSVAFAAVARVVLVAAKVANADGDDRRILARSKSNIGPDDGGFEYHLEQVEALPGIDASRVAWGAAVVGSARDLLAVPDDGDDDGEAGARDSATDFLRQVLKDGPTPSKQVQAEAREAGHSWRTVRRASDELQVIKKKGDMGAWYWQLARVNLSKLSNLSTFSSTDNMDNKLDKLPPESMLSTQGVHVVHSKNVDNMDKLDNLPGADEVVF